MQVIDLGSGSFRVTASVPHFSFVVAAAPPNRIYLPALLRSYAGGW